MKQRLTFARENASVSPKHGGKEKLTLDIASALLDAAIACHRNLFESG